MVKNFNEFCMALNESGFSMGGGNAKGIYAIIPYDWKRQEFIDTPVKWQIGRNIEGYIISFPVAECSVLW